MDYEPVIDAAKEMLRVYESDKRQREYVRTHSKIISGDPDAIGALVDYFDCGIAIDDDSLNSMVKERDYLIAMAERYTRAIEECQHQREHRSSSPTPSLPDSSEASSENSLRQW